jgi:signal peptidase II
VRNWAILIGLTLLFLALDQVSKWLVRQNLAFGEAWAPIPALAKLFTVTHVQNTGVSFGQFQGFGWLFMLVNLVVAVAILASYQRIFAGQWQLRLAAALILAGGIGNLIDRLRTAFLHSQVAGSIWDALPMAHVTDFMDFKIWPVWNVADLCVVTGVAILAWTMWREEQAERTEEPLASDQ